jgi:hypothetical protein
MKTTSLLIPFLATVSAAFAYPSEAKPVAKFVALKAPAAAQIKAPALKAPALKAVQFRTFDYLSSLGRKTLIIKNRLSTGD